MRRAILPSVLVIAVVSLGLLAGCNKAAKEAEQKKAQMAAQFAEVQQMYADLQKAREELEATKAALAEVEAIPKRKRTEEDKARIEELTARIEELTATTSDGYDALQEKLADFLTVALNEFPEAPETAQGLEIYAKEAIFNADDVIAKSGDYKKAIEIVQTAKNYYESIGLDPLPELAEKMAAYDEMRFITRERFDQIKKGMTMDEVAAVAGVPYYMNKKKDEKRGIEYWLYPKREGGAAAVYFNKKGKVYSLKFDAVKPKVAE